MVVVIFLAVVLVVPAAWWGSMVIPDTLELWTRKGQVIFAREADDDVRREADGQGFC